MGWLFAGLAGLFIGFQCGRKYSDFHDLMFARRISHMMSRAEKLAIANDELEASVRSGRPSVVVRRAVMRNKR